MITIFVSVLALLILAIAVFPSGRARALGFLFAVPVGIVVYFVLGIGIARWLGVGRFYSLPLGAEHISDTDIAVSGLFWICLSGLVIQWMVGKGKLGA